jgi:16S rRNA (guanine527-N7)-methyltransferase
MKAAEILRLTARDPVLVRPFEGARERALYVYEKTGVTPERFPRRVGVAVKRPLAVVGGGRER